MDHLLFFCSLLCPSCRDTEFVDGQFRPVRVGPEGVFGTATGTVLGDVGGTDDLDPDLLLAMQLQDCDSGDLLAHVLHTDPSLTTNQPIVVTGIPTSLLSGSSALRGVASSSGPEYNRGDMSGAALVGGESKGNGRGEEKAGMKEAVVTQPPYLLDRDEQEKRDHQQAVELQRQLEREGDGWEEAVAGKFHVNRSN